MSQQRLNDALTRLSHFTTPPADVVAEAMSAYAARVADLEDLVTQKDERIGEEVSFQRSIRADEQAVRADLIRRQQQERRQLINTIGFAARVYDRAINAQSAGKKTIRLADLLEGKPEPEQ